ncbi:hypothetical protein BFJ69_g8582 [Fusarium oxysporum]|uniref:Uncharacterized protein n=1 Tax=Fusarium oxysporum TaxID=5507 RepID=A0A420N1X0_FUSOX|nr:hypothetical protein BFJ69_g8582 [Fusarium oxysporum]
MDRTGAFIQGTKGFAPYKLLLYRGRLNDHPIYDDGHRFIYLAQNKPGDRSVGDCFIRLEEVHNRMRGDVNPYVDDCDIALQRASHLNNIQNSNGQQNLNARAEYDEFLRFLDGVLRFRCWSVHGAVSYGHEEELCNILFYNVKGENPQSDHIEEFRVWAEILRRSQGDKLASKDFFGRYWDAVIPNDQLAMFQTGMVILVSEKYFHDCGYGNIFNPITDQVRNDIRQQVWEGTKRVLEAPRLKFKPSLSIHNVIFGHELVDLPDGWHGLQADASDKFMNNGWRYLEAHPGGLYSILVNCPVKEFLCSDAHYKPLWQEGYPEPDRGRAETLQIQLNRCGKTTATTTEVEHDNVVAARTGKRDPTQDRCVATNGYSSNEAMSNIYPDYYPDPEKAKSRRVAEWLHRSAFSYGGLTKGVLGSSQVANNLVLGTPDTNTVMMRYEAFVKRLAFHSTKGNGQKTDTVFVKTEIGYPVLQGLFQHWMANSDHRYTWLAPKLVYEYHNDVGSKPHVEATRDLFPFKRETSMLFQSLLDKSLEAKCWKWPCWDENAAVVEALVESTGVDGDQEENNEAELKQMLQQDLAQRDQQV